MDFESVFKQLDEISLTAMNGRITEIVGLLIKAVVPEVKMGEICMIKRPGTPLLAEVVGFTKDEVFLSPMSEMTGVGPSSEVVPLKTTLHIKVGPELLGRVLDGLGNPLDEDEKGPLNLQETYPVMSPPPDPLKRKMIETPHLR
jgi:type III secretion protein N (ATPase)